jgi:hypothetical protein
MMTIRTENRRNATTRGQKRIFVIESRHITPKGKTIRHILVFDDHPESLRLLGVDLRPRRQTRFVYPVLTIVLALVVGFGMFWPLL